MLHPATAPPPPSTPCHCPHASPLLLQVDEAKAAAAKERAQHEVAAAAAMKREEASAAELQRRLASADVREATARAASEQAAEDKQAAEGVCEVSSVSAGSHQARLEIPAGGGVKSTTSYKCLVPR